MRKPGFLIAFLLITVIAAFTYFQTTSRVSAQKTGSAPCEHETQWQGFYQAPAIPMQQVAQTTHEWNQLWQSVGKTPPTAFDTKKNTALGIFAGERPTGGFGVQIHEIAPQNGQLVVRYEVKGPRPDEMATMAFTTPYLIKVIPKTTQPIVFQQVKSDP